MLRGLSESLASRLLQAFPPDRGYARVEFSRDPMPPPVAHFLAQTLQSRLDIELDRHRYIRSDWFDYDHPDLQHAQLTFGAMLGQHARVPKDEWARLLGEAAHTTLSYLVRPVPTLVEFLFDDDEAVPVRDVYRGLAFFGPYPYLREVATSYLRQKNLQEVERSRFLAVLRHSDREITRDYDATAWLRLLTPLFNMMDAVSPDAGRSVPVELLDAFFEDKGAGSILLRLRDVSEDLGHRLTEDELRQLLEEPARLLTQLPSLDPTPIAMPEPAPVPLTAEPRVTYLPPAIRQILDPHRAEPTPAPLRDLQPEPAPAVEHPAAQEDLSLEPPAAQEEPSIEQPTVAPERPVPVEEPELVAEPEPVASHSEPLTEEPAPTDEAPVFVPSMEARIKAAQAPSLAQARPPILAPAPETAPTPAATPAPRQAPLPAPPEPAPVATPRQAPVPAPTPKQAPAATPRQAPVQDASPASPVVPPVSPVVPPVRPTAPPVSSTPPPAIVSAPPVSSSVPLWQQFQKGAKPPAVPAEPRPNIRREPEPPRGEQPAPRPQQLVRPPSAEPQPGSKGVPLWQQFRKPLSPHPSRPASPPVNLGPLEETVLGEAHPPDRPMYIQELFSGSVSEYERVLRRLETAASWSHASQIIAEEIFRKHQVNIYSEAAIAFTNAVEEQYRG